MLFRFPSLVKINDITLTDESRTPLEEDRDERSVIVDLASGKKKKYIKSIKRKWTISWENIPMDSTQTVDGFAGRNEIRSLAQLGSTVEFTIQDGINDSETYIAFIENYRETLLMRRTDRYSYNIQIELLERG